MKRYLGPMGLTSTFALWSLANVFTAIALLGAIGVLYQSFILFLGFGLYVKLKKNNLNLLEAKRAFPHAFFRMVGLCLLTTSLMYVEVGIVDTIVACNVFVVIFLLAPLEGEKPKPLMLIPLSASVIGVGMIAMQSNSNTGISFDPTLLFPLGAMVALAISIFFWRKCSDGITPTRYLTYMHGWVTLLCVPLFAILSFTSFLFVDYAPSLKQIGFISLALLAGNMGDILFSLSQKFSSYTQNALIAPSAAVFSSIFGWIIAGQQLSIVQVFGMVIVVASVGVASWINLNTPARIKAGFQSGEHDEIHIEAGLTHSPVAI